MTSRTRGLLLLAVLLALAAPAPGEDGPWWMTEPIRLVQTNLPLHYVGEADPEEMAAAVADYPANAWLLNLGGIYANYPTELDVQMPNPHLREGHDFYWRAIAAAKARGLRMLARFDFSRVPPELHEAHPEWSFIRADGTPLTFAGLFQTCVNRDYYRKHSLEIIEEALGRYPVDMVFINWFGNHEMNWYDRSENGTCHCPQCLEKWKATRDIPFPEDPFSPEYFEFMKESKGEAAAAIRETIHRVRPGSGLILYNTPLTNDHVDSMTAESRTSFTDAQSWWPYDASLQIDRDRHDHPEKMVFSITVNFINFRWRYVPHRPSELRMRVYQAMAYGGAPAYYMIGTLDQPDPTGPAAARPAFAFHERNEDLYVGQRNAARVLLVAGGEEDPGFRGAYRLLAEEHIPFYVQSDPDVSGLAGKVDLVVTTSGAVTGLPEYLAAGGRALVTGTIPPAIDLPAVARRWSHQDTLAAYWKLTSSELLASSKDTRTLFMSGEYVEYAGHEDSPLQLQPPALYGPPEMVSTPNRPAKGPGLLVQDVGQGRLAYLPWNAPALYYEHSNLALRRLLTDLVDGLLPSGRQLETDVHPLVETVLMRQPSRDRTLVHLLNQSGRLGASASQALPIEPFEVSVAGRFERAHSRRLGQDLPLVVKSESVSFRLPSLEEYDVVVLE